MSLQTALLLLAGLALVWGALFFSTIVWLIRRIMRPVTPLPTDPESLIPESNFVEVNGACLHYVQAGQGPDVVLLHGIGASIFIWRFLFPLLQTHYRVTAFDLLGF